MKNVDQLLREIANAQRQLEAAADELDRRWQAVAPGPDNDFARAALWHREGFFRGASYLLQFLVICDGDVAAAVTMMENAHLHRRCADG